jgi:small GTP-binding protein
LVENVISELDEDNDGKLSFDEFFLGFRSFARKLQDEGEGPVDTTHTDVYNADESVFETHSIESDERWSRAASRMSLPENLAQSTQLKGFWNKVFDTDPQLIQHLESTLVEVGKQLKESKENLQLLERHMKKKDSQHVAEVASLEEELEGHLNDIILEYSSKGDSLEKTLEGRYNVAVVEREAEIMDLLKQVEGLKQELSEKESKEYKLSQNLQRFDACSFRNLFSSNQDLGQTAQPRKRCASADDILFKLDFIPDTSIPMEESLVADFGHHELSHTTSNYSLEDLVKSGRSVVVRERVSDIIGLTTPSAEMPVTSSAAENTSHPPPEGQCSRSQSPVKENGNAEATLSTVHPPPQFMTPTRVYKIVVLGDSGVGKTLLISNLCSSKDPNRLQSTVGVDYLTTVVQYSGETIALQFWDTAGQERFAPVCALYLRRADAVIVTYDITNMSSFENVKKWIDHAKAAQRDDMTTYMLIGTKTDLETKRVVSTTMAQQKALSLKALFCEVSSMKGKNLPHVLSSLSKYVYM